MVNITNWIVGRGALIITYYHLLVSLLEGKIAVIQKSDNYYRGGSKWQKNYEGRKENGEGNVRKTAKREI
ncbi:MAG: hypothetical protein ACLU9T_15865 [Blautia faecis]